MATAVEVAGLEKHYGNVPAVDLATLALIIATLGVAIVTLVPEHALKVVVGALLLLLLALLIALLFANLVLTARRAKRRIA